MKKLLLIVFCLPIIGFGQKFQYGILLNTSINNTTPAINTIPISNIYSLERKHPVSFGGGLTLVYNLKNNFSLNSNLIFHQNLVETDISVDISQLTLLDFMEFYSLPNELTFYPSEYVPLYVSDINGLIASNESDMIFQKEVFNYLTIPIYLKKNILIKKKSNFNLAAGFSFDYLISSNKEITSNYQIIEDVTAFGWYNNSGPVTQNIKNDFNDIKRVNTNIIFGFGYSYSVSSKLKLLFDTFSSFGITSIYKQNQTTILLLEDEDIIYNNDVSRDYWGYSDYSRYFNVSISGIFLIGNN